jgi:predicted small lipoprotein YifL
VRRSASILLVVLTAAACGRRGESALPGAESSTAGQGSADAATAEHADPGEPPAAGFAAIDTADLHARLAFYASDLLEGRQAGTRGAELAAAYIASELAAIGLEPAGDDGTYVQAFPMAGFGGPSLSDSSANVVAILRGADPALADEFVALGAHYDHVGVGAPVAGDSIYNGADDDGSGTVALLELAEALAGNPPPGRSVLFVFHGAEEAGLVGSFYYTAHPTVPLESIVAQLNMDMLGRNSPDSLFVIGAGRISSELDRIVSEAAEETGLALDYTLDAPDHPEQLYTRSDHFNYARFGIPVAFVFAGLHEDYHQPSDEVEKIDFVKLERVAELVYRIAWELATRPEPPARDRLHG